LESYTDKLTAGEREYVTENMARSRSKDSGATGNILDTSYNEIRITFKKTVVVGVGYGMFYCGATEVIDTTINDNPMTLISDKRFQN